jgi:hypothetical protein
MRTRWLVPVAAIVAVVGVVVVLRAGAGSPSSASSSSLADREETSNSPSLPARTVTIGAVDVVIEPIRIDETAAVFRVVMETHSEELSADLATGSLLEVDGVQWTGASWSGDPPGGHHREGELTFEAGGPAAGSAVLSIGGFSAPVEASWTLSGNTK